MRNDLVGKRFGKLVAKKLLGKEQGRALWLCECDCGSSIKTRRHNLTTYGKTSCGCQSARENLVSTVFKRYKKQAEQRGLQFTLTKDQLEDFIFSKCSYCGRRPENKLARINMKYNGIDRMNNKQGYNVGNCVSACKVCNKAKGTMSVREFHHWIIAVYEESICDKD